MTERTKEVLGVVAFFGMIGLVFWVASLLGSSEGGVVEPYFRP